MLKRHDARELAFQLLFEYLYRDDDMNTIIDTAVEAREIEPDEFTLELARGAVEHIDELDGIIGNYAKGRTLTRLSGVVRSCLRLALYEICYEDDIDSAISINEAVEIAKVYSTVEESGYVNGVLGSYVRSEAFSAGGGKQ